MQHIIPMELTDLNSSIEMKLRPTYGGLPEYGTAEGDIASFITNINYPLKKLEADIVAQQDLHGYDHPWAGGAGKNKLQVTATTTTTNGVTFTVNADGSVRVNGTATADITFNVGVYLLKGGTAMYLNGSPIGGAQQTIRLGYQGYSFIGAPDGQLLCDRRASDTDWNNYVYIAVANGYTANNITFKPMMRDISVSDATYEPYENICPIVGYDEVEVNVAGKNLFNYNAWKNISVMRGTAVWENNGITLTATGNDAYTTYGDDFPNIYVKAGHTYTLSWESDTSKAGTNYVFFYDASGTYIRLLYTGNANQELVFTPNEGEVFVRFRMGVATSGVTIAYKNIMVRINGDNSYEPYKGETYTTDLDGTRYGGTLDVTTGVLTLTHIFVSLNGSENWYIAATGTNRIFRCTAFSQDVKDTTSNPFISNYAVKSDIINDMENLGFTYWYFRSTAYSVSGVPNTDILLGTPTQNVGMTLEEFKAMLSTQPLQILGELATPQTVQLTPTEVETVVGQNHIWANSGQVYVGYHFVEDFEE